MFILTSIKLADDNTKINTLSIQLIQYNLSHAGLVNILVALYHLILICRTNSVKNLFYESLHILIPINGLRILDGIISSMRMSLEYGYGWWNSHSTKLKRSATVLSPLVWISVFSELASTGHSSIAIVPSIESSSNIYAPYYADGYGWESNNLSVTKIGYVS